MRKWMGAAVGAAALLGSVFAGGTASADTTASRHLSPGAYTGYNTLKSVATGKCVDDSNYGLRDFGCQDPYGQYAAFQQFLLLVQPNGSVVIQNKATGKCVDDSNYGLRDFGCQDQSGQYAGFQQFWPIPGSAPNTTVFQSVATGKCIDDSNYGLRDFGCQDQSGQYAGFQQFVITGY
ncbi:RICIN domain-containing protein [Kitasatospora sp. NPDC089509]|uniref:RICIN domain-containing protein n=1 Tax=Kitasatospora sp. NPDC089509 TaxID=3364079 RepID=UPI0037F54AA9